MKTFWSFDPVVICDAAVPNIVTNVPQKELCQLRGNSLQTACEGLAAV